MKKLFKMKTILIKVLMVVLVFPVIGITTSLGQENLDFPNIGENPRTGLVVVNDSGGTLDPNCLDIIINCPIDENPDILYNEIMIETTTLNYNYGVPGINLPEIYFYVYIEDLGFDFPVFISESIEVASYLGPKAGDIVFNSENTFFENIPISLWPYNEYISCLDELTLGFTLVLANENSYEPYNGIHPQLFETVDYVNLPVLRSFCLYSDDNQFGLVSSNQSISQSDSQEVSIKEGAVTDLTIYPNPFSEQIVFDVHGFEYSDETLQIEVMDMTGSILYSKLFHSEEINEKKLVINDLSKIGSGAYFFRIKSKNKTLSRKILKK